MPTIKTETVLLASEKANPLTGSQYEYLPWPARIEVAILADATDEVEATFFSGSDVLLENAELDTRPIAEAIQYPWDYDIEDVAAAGERLGLTIRETSGVAPAIVRTRVRITPL